MYDIEMFNKNIRLVYKVCNRYIKNYKYIYEDLVQEGMLALHIACSKFDESKGYRFSTYACKVISNTINYYIRGYKKKTNYISLDDSIYSNDNGDIYNLYELIEGDSDVNSLLESSSIIDVIYDYIDNNYNENDKKKILYLYYNSIINEVKISQRRYNEILGTNYSQAYISRIISRCNNKLSVSKELKSIL